MIILFLDSEFIDIIAAAKLAISQIWCTPPLSPKKDSLYKIIFEAPKCFTSEDDNNFFAVIASLKGVSKIVGYNGWIVLHLSQPYLDELSLRTLIAVMLRYDIDMSRLKSQCNEKNAIWFKNPRVVWYKKIFGEQKRRTSKARKQQFTF